MSVLVLGISGMIGHRVWVEAQKCFGENAYGLMRKDRAKLQNPKLLSTNILDNIDVSDWQKVESVLNEIQPKYVVNALGITLRKPEIKNIHQALLINSLFPRRLHKWVQERNSKLIQISTDCVFDGKSELYTETSRPNATDIYGQTKFLGEVDGSNSVTLRFSCIGRELDSHTELLDWFLSQKEGVTGYSKVMYSGVTTHVVAREICRVISDYPKMEGLFHISGQPISKYDLLILINKISKKNLQISKDETKQIHLDYLHLSLLEHNN
jgi:dTDP-4-dehydrorhamnose reductase